MFAARNSSPVHHGYNTEEVAAYQIKLKKVLGLTVCSNAALDVSPTTGVLAYPAGCTVVLFNSKRLTQAFLLNTSRKAVTAIAYSRCGRYIATGECGINPSIKVWELEANGQAPETGSNTAGTVVAEFTGHKNAVSCVAFSPNGKYLVSVGSQNDMIVNVFDWKSNIKIASNKVSAKVVAVSFSDDGSYFVTVGNRHVKFWYLEGSTKYKDTTPLMGRSAILGDFRNNDFCAVACGKGVNAPSTYSIIRSGHLVEFNSRRLLDKWVDCRTTSANCLTVNAEVILVGCAESIIRVFNAETLTYVTTLPRTHYLGVDVAQGIHINHVMAVPPNAKFPDTIACVFDEARAKVSCIYNDHSLYIWDLKDIRRVGKSYSFLYHSACIWGVESVPFDYTPRPGGGGGGPSPLPDDCFLTCSSDDTIRVWDLDGSSNAGIDGNEIYRSNIYSRDLLKVAYIDDELKYIKDKDSSIWNGNEKGTSFDGRNGVRCTKISPDRIHMASGDRSGNIRIYNLASMKLITTIEAHDSEVLCLEYTNEKIERKLLGSASRDRLIHVFDVENGYNILQTLDDHSSSITSIKFIGAGAAFQMVSCGADKAIIFRAFQNNQFQRGNHCNGKNTLYDMEVDSNSKHILLACQDRNIRVFGTQNAKQTKTFKGSHSDEGCLIKLTLDMSGIYVATSCTDKTLSVYDYYSNECMARMYGHSELVTGLKFTNDCKHLISASGDGCIFIWQVPHDMVVTMQARLSQQALRSGYQPIAVTGAGGMSAGGVQRPMSIAVENPTSRNLGMLSPVERDGFNSPTILSEDTTIAPGYKLSDVGQLPQWAKRKAEDTILATSPPSVTIGASPNLSNQKPRGRWALKGDLELDLRNIVDPSSPTPPPMVVPASNKEAYNNPYLSEDSSIDSGVENRLRKQLVKGSVNSESNTEHDGDVEDISDGERTSSEHGMMFYPDGAPGTPTDFKVNEMNAEELRKSIRRTKLEKQGMPLNYIQNALLSSAGTGTGTSDDEDEASTPSGDNGDRSLASTLGGSAENLPLQTTNSFLHTIEGGLSDRERGGFVAVGRKSISAKHNNHGGVKEEITKSYTSNKKEELMKVINAAKQQLDNVGYRTRLRGSQSTMDLSQQKHLEQRLDRRQLTGNRGVSPVPQQKHPVSGATSPTSYQLNQPQMCRPGDHSLVRSGILVKTYRSCPVSPVQEDYDWLVDGASSNARLGYPPRSSAKRPIYREDAKILLDSIHANTEKMIKEITDKYGNFEEMLPPLPPIPAGDGKTSSKLLNKRVEELKYTAQKDKNEHGFLSEDESNFSSDSLEDCSLNAENEKVEDPRGRRKVCRKHPHGKATATSPRNSGVNVITSVHDSAGGQQRTTMYDRSRNVSLSEILMDDKEIVKERNRRSDENPLGGEPKSEESFLSDDFSNENLSYYNSMESIMSDESGECKSAPLEVIFGAKQPRNGCRNLDVVNQDEVAPLSKSYGSSPNNCPGFDYYYMQNAYSMANGQRQMVTSNTFPKMSEISPDGVEDEEEDIVDEIPSSRARMSQYKAGLNKSVRDEFGAQRAKKCENPLQHCEEIPIRFRREDIFGGSSFITGGGGGGGGSGSGSFFGGPDLVNDCESSRTEQSFRKFEQNLQKFERDRSLFGQAAMQMDYVPHKPPVAGRRSTSMRSKRRKNLSGKFNTMGNIDQFQEDEGSVREKEGRRKREKEEADEEKGLINLELNFNEPLNNLVVELPLEDVDESERKLCNLDVVEMIAESNMFMGTDFARFNDIRHKIEIVQKLVAMEERKLEEARRLKESRMRPFEANVKEKGYVKSLTMNFDNLAKGGAIAEGDAAGMLGDKEEGGGGGGGETTVPREFRVKRIKSVPELESVKFRSFQVLPDESPAGAATISTTTMTANTLPNRFYNDLRNRNKNNTNEQQQQEMIQGHANNSFLSISNEESSIRRACSLSDLSIGKGFKTPSKSGNSRLSLGGGVGSAAMRSQLKRSSMSGSVGMLNQVSGNDMTNESESDQDARGGLMKPTISSQNKANGALRNSNSNLRRRGMQSSGNLFMANNNQDDSSSEETNATAAAAAGVASAAALHTTTVTVNSPFTKPVVPPRPRSILSTTDHKKHNNLNNNVMNAKNSSSSNKVGDQYAMDLMPSKEADLSNEKLTPQLCSGIINQLRVTIQSVLQLHERLREEGTADGGRVGGGGGGGVAGPPQDGDSDSNSANFQTMRSELENAVMMTQNMLTNITNNNNNSNNGSQSSDNRPEGNRNSVSFNLPPSTAGNGGSGRGRAGAGAGAAMDGSEDYRQMYDTCSDILNTFQKHVNNNNR